MINDRSTADPGNVRLRVNLVWTVKTGVATAGLALFGLLGLFVIWIGVTEYELMPLLVGAAMVVLLGGMAVALAVQRSRHGPVLELGDFGVRGYSIFPRTRQVWQLRWDEVVLLGAFAVKVNAQANYRYLAFVATEQARAQRSRPKGSPKYPQLWFSVNDSGWSVSMEDVVRCAQQFRPELEFSDTRGT